ALLSRERRRQVIDIQYLRPWARHVLNEEEGLQLLTPVTAVDVKQIVFDIVEDKAPRPDGFSSDFYRAAWPIVGPEVTKAILEFFTTGKLLKQIITTLLAVIPKAAFIPGRSVGDNILSAQELFTGYNQAHLPPRCALKVDRGVCHDTLIFRRVEWETSGFLYGIERVTAGGPYITISVRSRNGDDLLLLCKADMDSIEVFKQGLDLFASWSDLRLNLHKSHLIIFRSAQGIRKQLLVMLDFQEGYLPMRYLGLPLLSSRLSLTDFQSLLLKIDQRIKGWEGMRLTYDGKVQIIKSVLMALSIYWASTFILPKGVIRDIEKRLRAILWKGTTTSVYAKVACRDVYRPASERGQGLRDIAILNRALMSKKLCNVIGCDRTSI
ncbi:UNVERIFIED_CONTAM: hypothetical protein Sindi_1990300, partial [Sesamum indicum]